VSRDLEPAYPACSCDQLSAARVIRDEGEQALVVFSHQAAFEMWVHTADLPIGVGVGVAELQLEVRLSSSKHCSHVSSELFAASDVRHGSTKRVAGASGRARWPSR
jgi:hypothetical protein